MSKSFGDIDMNVCNNNAHTPYKKITGLSINSGDYTGLIEIHLDDDYEYKLEVNKLYALKKKPKYPTTYDECCDILNANEFVGYELVTNFPKLINARNAYWRIAGEEMGLGKPWEPNWENYNEYKYCIYITENTANTGVFYNDNRILAFPTEEMRDAFYGNFKDLIEKCKELL